MGIIKVNIEDEIEKKFREVAMKKFGYSRGSLSSAAKWAFEYWIDKEEDILNIRKRSKKNPIKSMVGVLSHVKKTSIELEDEMGQIIADEVMK